MADPTPVADSAADTTLPLVPEGELIAPQPPSGSTSSGTPPDAILAMIERASRDPAVDLAKLEGLMAMKERVEKQRASIAYAEAFVELLSDLPTIDRNGRLVVYSKADRDPVTGAIREGATPIQTTKYAKMDDILAALLPVLHKHGFFPRFEHQTLPDGRIATTAILRHRAGHEERATTVLKHDIGGSKNDVQAAGSSQNYGRRYSLLAVLPIVSHAPEDADDDGVKAGQAGIDADQLAYIQQLLRDTGSDVSLFVEHLGATSLAELTVKQYQNGLEQIRLKQKKLAQKAKP